MLDSRHPRFFRWTCLYCHKGMFLGSGLDDYPRFDDDQISIAHLDIHNWMIFLADGMSRISGAIGKAHHAAHYAKLKAEMVEQMDEFLDRNEHIYSDMCLSYQWQGQYYKRQYSGHVGYIQFFPIISGALASGSKEFAATMALLQSPDTVFSRYGIRSLSKADELYATDENYWRGNIWVPINYMILRGLKLHYAQGDQAAAQLYQEIRAHLYQNVYVNWAKTGYLFENYNPENGQGERGHPFNGWTSAVVLLLKELFY